MGGRFWGKWCNLFCWGRVLCGGCGVPWGSVGGEASPTDGTKCQPLDLLHSKPDSSDKPRVSTSWRVLWCNFFCLSFSLLALAPGQPSCVRASVCVCVWASCPEFSFVAHWLLGSQAQTHISGSAEGTSRPMQSKPLQKEKKKKRSLFCCLLSAGNYHTRRKDV